MSASSSLSGTDVGVELFDFSCYITIVNKLNCSLSLINKGDRHGDWKVDPPFTIHAGSTSSQFHLKDRTLGPGTEGWVQYRVNLAGADNDNNKPLMHVSFADPTGNGENRFEVSVTNTGGSTCHLFALSHTKVPKIGHPVTVTLTVDYDEGFSTRSTVMWVTLRDLTIRVRNTKDEVNFQDVLQVWTPSDLAKYEDNSDDHLVGSYFPVAVDVTDTSPKGRAVELLVNVDQHLLGVPFVLCGGNDAFNTVASSDPNRPFIFNVAGLLPLNVFMSPPWASDDTPWAVIGNISWRFHVVPTGQDLKMNSTRLEFYAINKSLPSFYKSEVHVTLLRRFVAPLRDKKKAISGVTHCSNQTFSDFGFVYDSVKGGAKYAGSQYGGSFRLSSYLKDVKMGFQVNCYDQASITQICLGLAPATAKAKYVFMKRFGWIVTTELIGRGECNNPFFLNRENHVNPNKICDNNAPDRSSFGNHAFVSLDPDNKGQIVDTCAGPVTGTMSLDRYITAAIQTTKDTTLYADYGDSPGTASDADFTLSGVSDLKGTTDTKLPTLTDATSPRFSPGVEHMIEIATAGVGFAGPERRSNAALSDLFSSSSSVLSSLGWNLLRTTIAVSPSGTDAEWLLTSADKATDKPTGKSIDKSATIISVTLFLAADGLRGATVAFGQHLGTYSRELNESLFRAPIDGNHVRGQLNLESTADGRDGSAVLLWVYGNAFLRISHRRVGTSGSGFGAETLQRLADAVHACIVEGAKDVDDEEGILVPKVRELKGPEGDVKVGETFMVTVSMEGGAHAMVDCKQGNAVMMERYAAEGYFKFSAVKAGLETITFSFAHQQTLNSTSSELQINIVDA